MFQSDDWYKTADQKVVMVMGDKKMEQSTNTRDYTRNWTSSPLTMSKTKRIIRNDEPPRNINWEASLSDESYNGPPNGEIKLVRMAEQLKKNQVEVNEENMKLKSQVKNSSHTVRVGN